MAYSYGYGDSGRYGGYGGFQDFDRHRGTEFGGVGGASGYYGNRDLDRGYNQGYGVPSIHREHGYGGIGGGRNVRTDVYEYSARQPTYTSSGVYGPSSYDREQRGSSKYRVGGSSSSRRYGRDTDRSFTKYRNKNRDTSTSSSSSSEDGEGVMERMGNKIKGVFGYGPDAQNSNKYDNQYGNQYGSSKYNNDQYSSRRANKYNTGSNTQYNTGGYGGSYGGYGNEVVSLRGRREVAPSVQEESGQKQLIWQVNAQGFDTDNIRVSDAGNNKIEISGQAEDIGQHHRRTKQFTRIITLPEGANAKEIKSRISGRGLLTITVPYTGKGLQNYGTRELQVGQGSMHSGANRLTGSTTASSASKNNNDFSTGGAYQQQHQTTSSTTRSTTNA